MLINQSRHVTFCGITNNKWQLIPAAVYVLHNYAVYRCDRVSLSQFTFFFLSAYLTFFNLPRPATATATAATAATATTATA